MASTATAVPGSQRVRSIAFSWGLCAFFPVGVKYLNLLLMLVALILAWLLARFVREGWRSTTIAGGITVITGVSMFSTVLVHAAFCDAALGMALLWLLAVSSSAQSGPADA